MRYSDGLRFFGDKSMTDDIKTYRCVRTCCPKGRRALPSTGVLLEVECGTARTVADMQSHEFYPNGMVRCLVRLGDIKGDELCYVVCTKGPDE